MRSHPSCDFVIGCGTYSEWKETNRYQRIDNKCHIVHKRSCDYLGGSCEGPSEKLVETDIANCVGSVFCVISNSNKDLSNLNFEYNGASVFELYSSQKGGRKPIYSKTKALFP